VIAVEAAKVIAEGAAKLIAQGAAKVIAPVCCAAKASDARGRPN
jgi:hypothetical protein